MGQGSGSRRSADGRPELGPPFSTRAPLSRSAGLPAAAAAAFLSRWHRWRQKTRRGLDRGRDDVLNVCHHGFVRFDHCEPRSDHCDILDPAAGSCEHECGHGCPSIRDGDSDPDHRPIHGGVGAKRHIHLSALNEIEPRAEIENANAGNRRIHATDRQGIRPLLANRPDHPVQDEIVPAFPGWPRS